MSPRVAMRWAMNLPTLSIIFKPVTSQRLVAMASEKDSGCLCELKTSAEPKPDETCPNTQAEHRQHAEFQAKQHDGRDDEERK